jgi:uncharacterized repeat protein (TIGR01451 family)
MTGLHSGDSVTYTLTYTNFDLIPVTGIFISDILGIGLQFVSSSIPYTASSGNQYDFDLSGITLNP